MNTNTKRQKTLTKPAQTTEATPQLGTDGKSNRALDVQNEDLLNKSVQEFEFGSRPLRPFQKWSMVFERCNPGLPLYLMDQAWDTASGEMAISGSNNDLILQLLNSIKPQDELEALLATQMVGCHNLAMKFMRLAAHPDQSFEGACGLTEQANKSMRTFAVLMEALNRHRGKGQQKVVVEHVTVNQGGQAVVGSVTQNPGGGGGWTTESTMNPMNIGIFV